MSERQPSPRPITPWTLPGLAWRTATADRANYRGTSARTAGDVVGSVWPSLREPVFLVGSPRSGTTFLGDCVAAVPAISYHFEPVATKAAARYVHEGRWPEWWSRVFYRGVYRWLLRIHAAGRRRFAEKTPRNCFLIGFLHRTFPDARFLYLVRDGRDAALSHRDQPWLRAASARLDRWEPGGYRYGPWAQFWVEPDRRDEFRTTTDLHRTLWAWRRHNEAVLEQIPALQDAVMTVRYEELVGEPARHADAILDFLGVGRPEDRDRFHAVAGRASATSVGRWRRELSEDELRLAESEIGPLLRRLGYAHGPEGR